MQAQREARTIGVCLVSRDEELANDVEAVLGTVNALLAGEGRGGLAEAGDCPYRQVLAQAARFLDPQRNAEPLRLALLRFDSPAAARAALAGGGRPAVECLMLDARGGGVDCACDPFPPLLRGQPDARLSPCSALLLCEEGSLGRWMGLLGGNRLVRVPHPSPAARRADLLRMLVDHLEHAYFNRLLARGAQQAEGPATLAVEVHRLMRARWQERWDFHFFTGSMVAGFIDSMHALARGSGVSCLSGCNEHALAVGALAGWQLHGRAYVIAVTSGMMDEARGTLANLKRAAAPGLIVCAESPETVWYAFQGTLDGDNDGHRVISARGLGHVFMRRPEEVAGVAAAAAELDARPAPFFLFATQAVLESRLPTRAAAAASVAAAPVRALTPAQRDRLEQAVAVLNGDPARLLWQCGRLSAAERERVLALAERAGIALADSITSPGSVPAYRQRRPLPNYLGPLSMYGFSRRIHAFLEEGGDAGAAAGEARQPWLFFLKGKVDQSATPYSEGRLKRNFRVAQVNWNAAHMSPFTRLALDVPLETFLDYLEPRLQVAADILAHRRARLERLRLLPEELPSDRIETLPMMPGYFFHRLGALLRELIEEQGYRYTGVYDVGRCSLSALRNLPRTDEGFSGWYGRALMGDALMALPYLALKGEHNLLAFIGDGARALVPSVEQRLILAALQGAAGRGRNVTVFYLTNGVLSMIQTYLDKRYALHGACQVNVPVPEPLEQEARCGGIRVYHGCLRSFCPATLRAVLTAPAQVNFLDVWLGHNSEGDGLSLVSESGWSRLATSHPHTERES